MTKPPRTWLDDNPPPVSPAYDRALITFERLTYTSGLLLVECKACGKRRVLSNEECQHIREGNKTPVRSVTFRCRCGSTDVRLYAGCSLEEAAMFQAGDPVDPAREIPEKPEWET